MTLVDVSKGSFRQHVLGVKVGTSSKYLTFCMAIISMGLRGYKSAGNGMIRASRGLMVAVLVHIYTTLLASWLVVCYLKVERDTLFVFSLSIYGRTPSLFGGADFRGCRLGCCCWAQHCLGRWVKRPRPRAQGSTRPLNQLTALATQIRTEF